MPVCFTVSINNETKLNEIHKLEKHNNNNSKKMKNLLQINYNDFEMCNESTIYIRTHTHEHINIYYIY